MLVGTADSQPKYKQTIDYTDTWISCLAHRPTHITHTCNMHAYMAGVVVAQHVAGKSNETVIVDGDVAGSRSALTQLHSRNCLISKFNRIQYSTLNTFERMNAATNASCSIPDFIYSLSHMILCIEIVEEHSETFLFCVWMWSLLLLLWLVIEVE